LAIVLATGTACFAQYGGGLFQRGEVSEDTYFSYYYGYNDTRTENGLINLPGSHGGTDDAQAPLGSGILLLTGMGAAYLVSKKKKD